jgi:probable rRNA maturation factor
VDDDQSSDRPRGGQRRSATTQNDSANTVAVRTTLKGRRLYLKSIERFALRMLDDHGVANAELSILIAGDAKLRRLNRQYRRLDLSTDVLSFAQDPPYGPSTTRRVLGDIVVSADRAVCQARDAGHTLKAELMLLVAHGALHLLGYDHHTPRDETKMRVAEQAALDTRTGLLDRAAGSVNDG